MALKDWNKVINEGIRTEFYNKKTKKVIQINYLGPFRTVYEILIGYKWETSEIRKEFKIKAQALKFAKAYMRKH